ncbi:MAG: four helix bundle protein [Thermoanaerobaculia bacterium]
MKRSFRDLFVWQASVDLAVMLIDLSDRLVAARRFALADQLVRTACSVPNNIAEGQGRYTTADRCHYLVQARGSLYEVDTQLEILTRAKLANDVVAMRDIIAKVESGLTKMIDRLHRPVQLAPLRLYDSKPLQLRENTQSSAPAPPPAARAAPIPGSCALS